MGSVKIIRAERPASGPPPVVRLPRFQRFALSNGLTVLVVRHGHLPEVSGLFVLPFGASNDRPERGGTALMVARALTEGTDGRSAGEIAEALDFLGARFRIEVSHDASVLSAYFLSHVRAEALDLFAEIVTRPAFAEEEVERLRDERRSRAAWTSLATWPTCG